MTDTGNQAIGDAELRALVAATRLIAGQQLAEQSRLAPDLELRLWFARTAAEHLVVASEVVDVGALATFEGLIREAEQRTRPTSWLEGNVRGHAAAGLARELVALVRPQLPESASHALDAAFPIDEPRLAALVRDAVTSDSELRDRASLYGRRLLAELLVLVQQVVARHPELAGLVTGSSDDLSVVSEWFPQLEAGHADRMTAMGLLA
ncbi:MAG TPA: ferritin-like fold-containing protein [Propionibacteriaceae bacterium]|nr:ferritin-like fold-containing protein [Propionibacteriaceae bacterium]